MESSEKQKMLYRITETLKDFHSKVSHEIQVRIPLEDLSLIGLIVIET